MKRLNTMLTLFMTLLAVLVLSACSGSGNPRIGYSMGMGYGGYYGSPYGRYGPPIIVEGPGGGFDGPVATPLPDPGMDFGMPDAGFNDFGGGFDDFGGFDF